MSALGGFTPFGPVTTHGDWLIFHDGDADQLRVVRKDGGRMFFAFDLDEARALIRAEEDSDYEAGDVPTVDAAYERWVDDTEDRRRDARDEDREVEAAWRGEAA